MRLVIKFLGLAIALGTAACSDGGKPPVVTKANGTIMFDGCNYSASTISGSGGGPRENDYGDTVPNGRGFGVSCKLTPSGASYSILAHLESPNASLDVQSTDISAGVSMGFSVYGSGGTPEPVRSADDKYNPAPTCVLTTSRPDTLLTLEPGTIFAAYNCDRVISSSNTSTVCRTSGLFQFTGCGS